MSIRNLQYLFKPATVALVGASARPGSVGALVARNLLDPDPDGAGFKGVVWMVNPKGRAADGRPAFRSVADLPAAPDLAVICTPADEVVGCVRALAARGAKAAIVVTAGFGEGGDVSGDARRLEMLQAARAATLRIVGPNCIGLLAPRVGLNASFAHRAAPPGGIAFLSQSGAVVTAVLDWAAARRIGFSHIVSLGAMADVDFGDLLDWLALDSDTTSILLHVESVTGAPKFMSAARAAARSKPVIVVKTGRTEAAARAAHSHTGAMAGADAVYDAAFRRAGMLRVDDLDELFEATATLGSGRQPRGERLAVLTNGGGLGVLAVDELVRLGGLLAELAPETLEALTRGLPPTWSHGNPVDILGDAPPARYEAAMAAVLADPGVDAVLAINAPTALVGGAETAAAVVRAAAAADKPVLTSWVGAAAQEEARQAFIAARLPTYDTPRQAVRGFLHLATWRRNRAQLMETPPSQPHEFRVDLAAARAAIDRAASEGRDLLGEPEAKQVLAAAAIPIVSARAAATPEAASHAAFEIGGPIALKIVSRDIPHKSDVGGVRLDLRTPGAVEAAAREMLERVRALRPTARIDGFSVQEMVRRPAAHELILGLADDATFGPVVLFGHGGVAVERFADRSLSLPPLNMHLARDMVRRTRVWRLLEGYRDRKPADLDSIALSLIKVSQLAVELPEIVELDVNPLLADHDGVLALDARIRVDLARRGRDRLAIRPYPRELESEAALGDGTRLRLRPIRPEDEPLLVRFVDRLSAEDIRLRFFGPMKGLSHENAARLTQIDYARQMALVATGVDGPDAGEFLGVVRIAADPDNVSAEYAVTVRSDLKGRGLGWLLMQRIVAYCRARGLAEVAGLVLRENEPMLRLCRELGFEAAPASDDPSVVRMVLPLGRRADGAAEK